MVFSKEVWNSASRSSLHFQKLSVAFPKDMHSNALRSAFRVLKTLLTFTEDALCVAQIRELLHLNKFYCLKDVHSMTIRCTSYCPKNQYEFIQDMEYISGTLGRYYLKSRN